MERITQTSVQILQSILQKRGLAYLREGGGKGVFYDPNCGHISCIRDETTFTCPWCNSTYSDLVPLQDKLTHIGADQ